jgi:hypothetical protein
MKLAKTVLVRLLTLVIGPPVGKTDLEALLGLTFRFHQKKGPAVRGTVVRVLEVPGRKDVVQVVLDDPESHSYVIPATMATKEYWDRYERKRMHRPLLRYQQSPSKPIDRADPDIVQVLIGVGLLAFEIAFVIIVGAKR